MITNIQLLRALAALSVVWFHTGFYLWHGIHTEFQGVRLFFAISGFIITFVSQTHPEKFLTHRFIRIVPMYWIATILVIIFLNFISINNRILIMALLPLLLLVKRRPAAYIIYGICIVVCLVLLRTRFVMPYFEDNFSLPYFLKSLFFIPPDNDQYPMLGVGWTLNIEMFFYVTFGISLMINRRFAPLMACIALIIVRIYNYVFGCDTSICTFYAHSYTTFFIFGVVIYYLYLWQQKHLSPFPKKWAIAITVVTALTWVVLNTVILGLNQTTLTTALIYILPPMILISALLCHAAQIRTQNKLILLVGNASYSLYLIHELVFESLRAFLVKHHLPLFEHSLWQALFATIFATLLGIVFYLQFEAPLLKKIKRFVDKPKEVLVA